MTEDSINSLMEIYHNFLDEAESLEKEIHDNELSISEAEQFLDNLYNSEPDDFRVFSPRNNLSSKKFEIEQKKDSIEKLKNSNIFLQGRLSKIKSYIHDLDSAMRNQEKEFNQAEYIFTIQEKERNRVADALHDLTLQNLTYLFHKVEIVSRLVDQDAERAKYELSVFSKQLKETIDSTRNVIFNLKPININDYGIRFSVERLIEKYEQINENIKFDFLIDDFQIEDDHLGVTIFHFLQETIYNAVLHSGGTSITIRLRKENDKCYTSVKDNGHGIRSTDFDYHNAHFGIYVLEERVKSVGGDFKISTSDKGTEVSAVFNL